MNVCRFCNKSFYNEKAMIACMDRHHYEAIDALPENKKLPYQRIKEYSNSTKIENNSIPGIPLESWHGRVEEASELKLIIQDS